MTIVLPFSSNHFSALWAGVVLFFVALSHTVQSLGGLEQVGDEVRSYQHSVDNQTAPLSC